MTSTIINEDQMLANLSVEASAANLQQLQTGACMVLLDAYDRKLTREQAEVYIRHSLHLFDVAGRFHAFNNAMAHYKETGAVTEVDLLQALAGCEGLVKKAVAEIIKLAHLLPECPDDKDTVQ